MFNRIARRSSSYLIVSTFATNLLADGPATRPAARTFAPGIADVTANQRRFNELFPHLADLADPEKRAKSGPEGVTALKKIVAGLTTAMNAGPGKETQMIGDMLNGYQAELVALDDPSTLADLARREKAGDAEDALRAQRIALLGHWFAAGGDAAKQAPLADQAEVLAKANVTSIEMTNTASSLSATAATPELRVRLDNLIVNDMKNANATRIKRNLETEAKSKALVGQPMVLAGITPDDRAFSTADWKGKVVLVDFWASWCGPCKAELPRVSKVYADYHDKGLEVLGVSNDYKLAALNGYTSEQKLPWPQLFDAAAAQVQEWNPLTVGFGVNTIPRMFLIDKKGVCRTITARSDFEAEIPKLLAEAD